MPGIGSELQKQNAIEKETKREKKKEKEKENKINKSMVGKESLFSMLVKDE